MTPSVSRSQHKINHIGISVANLEEAIAFYTVFLDVDPITPFEEDRTPCIDQLVGYEAKLRGTMFYLGDGFIELVEYLQPEPGRTDPETYNIGHMHLCLQVEDVGAEYRRLLDADIGVEFRHDGPVTFPGEGLNSGDRYLYLRTPDGTTFELFTPAPSDE